MSQESKENNWQIILLFFGIIVFLQTDLVKSSVDSNDTSALFGINLFTTILFILVTLAIYATIKKANFILKGFNKIFKLKWSNEHIDSLSRKTDNFILYIVNYVFVFLLIIFTIGALVVL
ncbi:hypothetical protein BK010_04560 [Tenericutes bacterium MO-XQ]|nr:hypothetical protein BK010_04560 [Tenericutes bacterium MO-XQ]